MTAIRPWLVLLAIAAANAGEALVPSVAAAQAGEPVPAQPAAPVPAQPAAPVPAQPAAPVPAQPAAWQAGYDAARQQMIAGKFGPAATRFSELAANAPDPASQKLARELADLCARWAKGGFVLRSPLQEADLAHAAARRADRRTTDELAVLYTAAVLYGIGSGVVLANHTEPTSNAGAILPALGFSAGSAGLVAVLDRKLGFRYGVPQSIVSGLFIGLEEAMAWSLWHEASVPYYEEWGEDTVSTIFWVGATAGAVAGGVFGTLYGTTPGRASFMGSAALWTGVVAGLAAGSIARDTAQSDDYAMLSAALALNAGAAAGAILGHEISPSIARVRFVDLGAIAGGLLFGGLYLALGDRNENNGRTLMGVAAAGISTGIGCAYYLTRDMDSDHRPGAGPPGLADSVTPLVMPAGGGGLILGLAGAL